MSIAKLIYTLILILPDILKLIEQIEQKNIERGLDKKVQEDIKIITKAFEDKDAEALNRLFNL